MTISMHGSESLDFFTGNEPVKNVEAGLQFKQSMIDIMGTGAALQKIVKNTRLFNSEKE